MGASGMVTGDRIGLSFDPPDPASLIGEVAYYRDPAFQIRRIVNALVGDRSYPWGMVASFSIDVDAAASIVRITMSGFFNPSDIERFVDARNLAHRELCCGPNDHVTLVDITQMSIQSAESVEAFGRVLSEPRFASRGIAFVVARSLARAQICRAAAGRNAMFFTASVDAERWLLDQFTIGDGDRDRMPSLSRHRSYG